LKAAAEAKVLSEERLQPLMRGQHFTSVDNFHDASMEYQMARRRLEKLESNIKNWGFELPDRSEYFPKQK
jgi:hypothetical protein